MPSQKSSLRTHTTEDCAPHASSPPLQSSSELLILGRARLVAVFWSQLSTNCLQLQLCFSTSKARPGGHRMAWRPYQDKSQCGSNILMTEIEILSSPNQCTELRLCSLFPRFAVGTIPHSACPRTVLPCSLPIRLGPGHLGYCSILDMYLLPSDTFTVISCTGCFFNWSAQFSVPK